ncbi:maltose regulon activator MalT [Rhodococcus sp. SGAir0479]|uniref:maltose regulon activator MalT n=1 Tax=Rhodococcus sp. SGAir0479 TaxID=2567884 RepID=UPI0010CD6BAA|nr:maltose regulon activator MalT [Rhodococcus sp. SGAir0479]QCQ90276.1 maltose regulon activator MalT [Rhodococcus sp. SGAir0479]
MSKEKWWVLAGPDCGWSLEQRPNGDHVVVNQSTAEEHLLAGYQWMHVKHDDAATGTPAHALKVLGEGPPPFGAWTELHGT